MTQQRDDAPKDLPLTPRKKILLGIGIAMFFAQAAAVALIAPTVTGPGDANVPVLIGLWVATIAWSAITVLLVVRQADLPDVATAAMIVTIVACAAFSLSAANDVRGTDAGTNLSDALMLGVTGGGLTAMIVWGAAMGIARALHLPTTAPAEGNQT